jgi:hypothetical protein
MRAEISPERVAPANMETINAKPSFPTPSNRRLYVAQAQRGSKRALQRFNVPLLDR